MKTLSLTGAALLVAVGAAHATPLDELAAAVRPLNAATSLTWIVKPDPKVPRPEPLVWQSDQTGWVIGRRASEPEPWTISDGKRRFIRDRSGAWKSAAALGVTGDDVVLRARAAVDALNNIVQALRNVRREGAALVGDLSPEFITKELTFDSGPPSEAQGTVRIWLRAGHVHRYQVHRKGTIRHRGDARLHDTTVEVEFADIGSTRVEAPPELRRLFEA